MLFFMLSIYSKNFVVVNDLQIPSNEISNLKPAIEKLLDKRKNGEPIVFQLKKGNEKESVPKKDDEKESDKYQPEDNINKNRDDPKTNRPKVQNGYDEPYRDEKQRDDERQRDDRDPYRPPRSEKQNRYQDRYDNERDPYDRGNELDRPYEEPYSVNRRPSERNSRDKYDDPENPYDDRNRNERNPSQGRRGRSNGPPDQRNDPDRNTYRDDDMPRRENAFDPASRRDNIYPERDMYPPNRYNQNTPAENTNLPKEYDTNEYNPEEYPETPTSVPHKNSPKFEMPNYNHYDTRSDLKNELNLHMLGANTANKNLIYLDKKASESRIAEINKDIEALNANLEDIEQRLNSRKSELTKYTAELFNLKHVENNFNIEKKTLLKDKNRYEAEIRLLENEIAHLNKKMEGLCSQKVTKSGQLEVFNIRLADEDKKIEENRTKYYIEEHKRELYESELAHLEEQVKIYKIGVQTLLGKKAVEEKIIKDLEQKEEWLELKNKLIE